MWAPVGLAHHSDDCNTTSCPDGFPLQNRRQSVLVGLGESSQDVDNLGHLWQLVLVSDLLLELGQVDLLSTIVRCDQMADDL